MSTPEAFAMPRFLDALGPGGTLDDLTNEDIIAAVVPLLRQVVAAHEDGQVAPLDGAGHLLLDGLHIYFEEKELRPPRYDERALRKLLTPEISALDVVGRERRTTEVGNGTETTVDLSVGRAGDAVEGPVYRPGYRSWEHEVGHHDALTDIYVLGLVIASLALGQDLSEADALRHFVAHRKNLFHLRPDLHPVIARTIVRMTELDRRRRGQDLPTILLQLESWREVELDPEFDLSEIPGFEERDLTERRDLVLARLEERLFDLSRRNPLLYFKPRATTLDLTAASVPLHFNPRTLRAEDILTWRPDIERRLAAGKSLALGSILRFREATYLPSILTKIRAEARRDRRELGFANLRLVVAFLRWHNLKEAPEERIHSPLVLLPVELVKKKGVRDQWMLRPLDVRAEVNPVLRHHLEQLYGLELPEYLDLEATDLVRFHEFLRQRIQASEPGVSLELVERPRVQLVYRRARRRLDLYLRRRRGVGSRTYLDLDYSYRRESFQPLGLRLFQARIQPTPVSFERVVGEGRRHTASGERTSVPGATAPPTRVKAAMKERLFAELTDGKSQSNPYTWELDLTCLTLGNFRYRKMALVRDYETLLEQSSENPVFDTLFSLDPRAAVPTPAPIPLAERLPVMACDPTQASAIAAARLGRSYIVQGPPGTGKSQTITNLIADFVARGQRVLFVCQKRAALDVVYLRLRQLGLAQLCGLVHDSQADKKDLIHDLRRTYESYLKGDESDDPESRRKRSVRGLEQALEPLRGFDAAMRASSTALASEPLPPESLPAESLPATAVEDSAEPSMPLWRVLLRLVELRAEVPELEAEEVERLPPFARWLEHRSGLKHFEQELVEVQPDGVLAHHPLAPLRPALANEERPHEAVRTLLDDAEGELADILASLREVPRPPTLAAEPNFAALDAWIAWARRLETFWQRDLLALLDPASDVARRFSGQLTVRISQNEALEALRQENHRWRERLSAEDTAAALAQAKRFTGRLLSFLQPDYWRLRKLLRQVYDFEAHRVRPTWTAVLFKLAAEHHAEARLAAQDEALARNLGWPEGIPALAKELDALGKELESQPAAARRLFKELRAAGWLVTPEGRRLLRALARLEAPRQRLEQTLERLLAEFFAATPTDLETFLANLRPALEGLSDFLPCLEAIAALPPELISVLRHHPFTLRQLEAALADAACTTAYRRDRDLARFDGRRRDRQTSKLATLVEEWQVANAASLKRRVERGFRSHYAIAQKSASLLSPEEKVFKKRYNAGRRELEHEFGKKMRYKSIRDLLGGAAGEVMLDLKPVWLMSPLAVSDVLPLDAEHFDAVIFDEASQIPLEEAVPALFRAPQTIVVGDEMQLPPTRFFVGSAAEDSLLLEEDGEAVEIDLSRHSFLNHAAQHLPSTLLGWHYRSRSEALILFSNAAFYEGRLLTVPEPGRPSPNLEEIVVARKPAQGSTEESTQESVEESAGGSGEEVDVGERGAAALLERSVSFHFLEGGVYRRRRNREEAEYIAQLVCSLLARENGLSLGVVAFSEAQQGEIDGALERLAQQDKDFRRRLETELEREDDGEFKGLLVRNLENIQGDERDVVILSICYGPDGAGKVRMNFGPINQGGGERRLNVAFSRARHHMAVVSSLKPGQITNLYNDGARCLRDYLRYAEAMSTGEVESARRVLLEQRPREMLGDSTGDSTRTRHAVVEGLTAELEARGFETVRNLGGSLLRVDLAVAEPGASGFRLGLLVDGEEHYRQRDLLERELMKPRLLEAFGWRVMRILIKDWYHERERVLAGVLKQLPPPPGYLSW